MKRRLVVGVAVALVCGGGLAAGTAHAEPERPRPNVFTFGTCVSNGGEPASAGIAPITVYPTSNVSPLFLAKKFESAATCRVF